MGSEDEVIGGIAAAMRVFSDPATLARMGAAAREHVRCHYLWSAKAQVYTRVYRDVLAKKS